MSVLLRGNVRPYDVVVDKVEDGRISLIVIKSDVVAAAGIVVDTFIDEQDAKQKGECFIRNLKLAVDDGYILADHCVAHGSGRKVSLNTALDPTVTGEEFKHLLEVGE